MFHDTQKFLSLLARMRPLILIFRFVGFFKIRFNITLPSDGGVANSFTTVVLDAFLIDFACYMPRSCHRRIIEFDIFSRKQTSSHLALLCLWKSSLDVPRGHNAFETSAVAHPQLSKLGHVLVSPLSLLCPVCVAAMAWSIHIQQNQISWKLWKEIQG